MGPPLLALLAPLLLAGWLKASDEARFDPPLGGVYLGITGRSEPGRVVVDGVEPGSSAERAGLRAGDQIVRLGSAGGFTDFDGFAREAAALRRGQPVDLEVMNEGQARVLTLVPDPAVLRDYYRVVAYLRESRFLREREGFRARVAEIESSVPQALRTAARSSEAYEILNRAVGSLGTSHTAVIPPWTYQNLFAPEHQGNEGYATGMTLERVGPAEGMSFFTVEVLEESPAALAGVLPGDEVLEVNGVATAESPRRSLAGYEAEHPRYTLQVERDESVELLLRRANGGPPHRALLRIDRPVSGLKSSAASVRRFERDGRPLGYVPLWNLLSPRLARLVENALGDPLEPVEGLVLDLRGRGGQVAVMNRVTQVLQTRRRPLAVLLDRETRSAKEILAFQLKGREGALLVGERTTGAVLPGGYKDLPGGGVVMLPVDPLEINRLTDGRGLEGRGVEPDLKVARGGPYSAGADPILEAGVRALLEKLRPIPRKRRL